jgi:hypothetical protein
MPKATPSEPPAEKIVRLTREVREGTYRVDLAALAAALAAHPDARHHLGLHPVSLALAANRLLS